MTQRPYVIDVMISAKAIAARIEELSAEIKREFKGTDKLVGLLMESKGVMRAGQAVTVVNEFGEALPGVITSGTFSPTLGQSIALARIANCDVDEALVEMRKKQVKVKVVKPVFVRNGAKV